MWTSLTGMILIVSVKVHNLSLWYRHDNINYTSLTNFSTKYLVMCKVYTDVVGIR